MYTGIYKITSTSNKIYIGQSFDIEKRFKYYKRLDCKNQNKLYNSLFKHGIDNHIFEILEEVTYSEDILNKKEVYYIQYYKDLGFELMNIKEGGSNGKHSDETKKEIGKKNKGNTHFKGKLTQKKIKKYLAKHIKEKSLLTKPKEKYLRKIKVIYQSIEK